MKKLFLSLLLFATSTNLISCQSPSKIEVNRFFIEETYSESVDYSKRSYSDYTYAINPDGLEKLINNESTFAFIYESDYCGYCTALKTPFFRYILTYKPTFYSLNTDSFEDYEELLNTLFAINDINGKQIFTENDGTPTMFFFQKGKLLEKMPKTKSMNSYRNLKTLLDARLKVNNQTLYSKESDLNKIKNNDIVFYYNGDKNQQFINEYLANEVSNTYLFPLYLKELSSELLTQHELIKEQSVLRKYENESYLQLQIDSQTTLENIQIFLQ